MFRRKLAASQYPSASALSAGEISPRSIRRNRERTRFDARTGRSLIEMLERRQLLTTSVWTGAAGDHLYSDAANWQDDTVPASGNDLQFPALTAAQTVDIDSARTAGNVFISGTYTFTTSALTLGGNLEVGISSTATFTSTLVITTNSHFTVDTSGVLTLSTLTDSTADTLDKYGAGNIVFGGDSAANWQLLDGTMTIAATTHIQLTEFAGTLTGAGQIDSLTNNGGVVSPNGGSIATADNAFISGGTFNVTLNNPTSFGNINNLSNAVTLTNNPVLNVTLGSSFPTAGGTSYTIIFSAGTAVAGTFAGLPQGATFDAGGERFTISYTGAGKNVVLTTVGAAPTVALSEAKGSILTGQSNTLTATVTGSNGGSAPTGMVTFTENGVTLGTSTLVAGAGVTSTASFIYAAPTNGSHTIIASYGGDTNYLTETSNSVTFTVSAHGPIILHAASATKINAKDAALSVKASDLTEILIGGLSYSWVVTHVPSGAKDPIITINNSHAAHDTTALFTKDGTYGFEVTVSNVKGQSVTSDVQYVVKQYARSLRITPHNVRVLKEGTQQFKVIALDQFARPMRVQSGVASYIFEGSGSITSTGLFSAGRLAGPETIEVILDGVEGDINLTIV